MSILTSNPSQGLSAAIIELYRRYGFELRRLRIIEDQRYNRNIFPTTGQYDLVESQVLYMILRDLRPHNVIEFSCNTGFSTHFSALALQYNGTGTLHSFELEPQFAAIAERNVRGSGLGAQVRFTVGDVKETLVPYIQSLDRPPEVVFIDSDHRAPFAQWYIRELLPILAPGTLVHVHDILPPGADVKIDNRPLVINEDFGENVVLVESLNRSGYVEDQDFVYLHNLTHRRPEWVAAAKSAYGEFEPYRTGSRVIRRQSADGTLAEWNSTVWLRYTKPISCS